MSREDYIARYRQLAVGQEFNLTPLDRDLLNMKIRSSLTISCEWLKNNFSWKKQGHIINCILAERNFVYLAGYAVWEKR